VSHVPLDTKLILHNARKLFRDRAVPPYFTKGDAVLRPPEDSRFTQQLWGNWKYPLTPSTPERAILELLDEVPTRETFHQADVLLEGLRNLRPRRLQSLLSDRPTTHKGALGFCLTGRPSSRCSGRYIYKAGISVVPNLTTRVCARRSRSRGLARPESTA
jgi:hypothetical protein